MLAVSGWEGNWKVENEDPASALSVKFQMLIVRVVCYCWAWQDPTFD